MTDLILMRCFSLNIEIKPPIISIFMYRYKPQVLPDDNNSRIWLLIHVIHCKSTPSPSPHKCLRGIEKHYFHTHNTAVRKIILLIHALSPDLFLSSFSSILSVSTIIPDLSRGAPGGTSALVSS